MNRKETLGIGILAALMLAAIVAVKPVAAQNSAVASDDDFIAQENSAKIGQDADNDIVISGIGNTATAASSQTASTSQSNTNTDNDVQVADADIALPLQ
jgi:hypothetical protein